MADNARVYSGTSEFLSVTNPVGIVIDAAWTFGAWVKPDSFGADGRCIFLAGPAGSVAARGAMLHFMSTGELILRHGGTAPAGPAATPVSTAGWSTVGVTKSGSGVADITLVLNGVNDGGGTLDPGTNLTTGDHFRLGDDEGNLGVGFYDGSMAWAFWLQGVELSPAAIDAYLEDPESLVDDYGPGGAVVADALKIFWPQQCDDGAVETDVSGVDNDGAYTGTTFSAGTGPSPTTPWDPCGGAIVATELRFDPAPPASVNEGEAFGFTVKATDASGNVDTSQTFTVTIATDLGALGGDNTVDLVAGEAVFTGMTLDTAGSATLTATGGSLTQDTAGVTVTEPPAGGHYYNRLIGNV